jgi:ribosomal-protein-alanine N-acetyltransferase
VDRDERGSDVTSTDENPSDTSARRVRLTERLRLEPVRRDHADDLLRLHRDSRVAEYFGPWTREYAMEFAAKREDQWRTDGVSKWVAYDRVDGSLVGRGGLSRDDVDGRLCLEVGWTVRGALWGRGYATEIGRAGLDFAFDELGADEVIALTETTNLRSRAVMERLGMREPREITFNDAPFVVYTLLRDHHFRHQN